VAAPAAGAANERALRKPRRGVTEMPGTAVLMSRSVLAGEPEARARFQAARNDEYGEIVGKCEQSLEAYAARVYAGEAEGQWHRRRANNTVPWVTARVRWPSACIGVQ
jgi:hypothetical protein